MSVMDTASIQEAKYKAQSVLGIINDTIGVGIAKILREESAPLDVAIIKATLQDEVVPKEKHVRTLADACSGSASREVVNYVITGLLKRLEENSKAWLVTLKTLIVFHRLMRETDPSFQQELLQHSDATGHHRILRLDSFADDTTKETRGYSAFIRTYSLYLDECLAVFRSAHFSPKQDLAHASAASDFTLKTCSGPELLEYLPAVQRLLAHLVGCVPDGAAQSNAVTVCASSLVLKEVSSVYKVVSEGVLNLVDRVFEMDREDALKSAEIVKEHLALNDKLTTYGGAIGGIPSLQGAVELPTAQLLPEDLLANLDEYIKDGPKKPEPSPPSMADLLGFQSFVISSAPGAKVSATAVAAAAAAATAGAAPKSFDAFASFTGPAPPAVTPAAEAAPPAPKPFDAFASFTGPAPPAVAPAPPAPPAIVPTAEPPAPVPAPQPAAVMGSHPLQDVFGDGDAFGAAELPPAPAPVTEAPAAAAPPAAPAPAPASPAASSPAAPSGNPFISAAGSGGASPVVAPPLGSNNPFAAAPGAAPLPVGGYSLHPPDPLNDITLDLFGRPRAPAPPKPMRPQGGAAAAPEGSPSASS